MSESRIADRHYCSQMCTDPMGGTSDLVDVWLLLEYRPTWRAKALAASDLAQPAKGWVQQTVAALAEGGLKARPQFVRQPEIDRDHVRLLVAVAGAMWEFTGTGYDFLQGLDVAAAAQRGAVAQLPGARRVVEPHYFVCTNGQRDLCCARFGLPVYNGLREAVGERAWQVSHLGGHRFAPNVLVLPDGLLYGRVSPEQLAGFVAVVEGGQIDFAHLRGRSCYPKHVQAAEAFAARADLRLLHVEGDERAARITFAAPGEQLKVAVEQSEPQSVLTSCGDTAPSEVIAYRRV